MNRTRLPAAMLLAVTVWWPMTADAQQKPPVATSPFAPIDPPAVDPDMLKAPAASPTVDADPVELKNAAKPLPRGKPLKMDLGTYDLQFRGGRNSPDGVRRDGLDSGELSNARSITGEERPRGYLGLKLSRPTN